MRQSMNAAESKIDFRKQVEIKYFRTINDLHGHREGLNAFIDKEIKAMQKTFRSDYTEKYKLLARAVSQGRS